MGGWLSPVGLGVKGQNTARGGQPARLPLTARANCFYEVRVRHLCRC